MMSDIAYIGLGSNLNDPEQQLVQAVARIHALTHVSLQDCSHMYTSTPMGPQNQPNFINAVCKITTSLTPIELLDELQTIELAHGRIRKSDKWGPRTLDLDILLFNNLKMDNDRLTLPHHGMPQREFVLVPLFEICPDMMMQDGKSLASWVADCSLTGLRRLPNSIDYSSFAL